MHTILLVEDSNSIYTFLAKRIDERCNIIVDLAHSFEEAKALVAKNPKYTLALLDVHLPDTSDTTMVDFMSDQDIPSIVMTSDFNVDVYEKFRKRNLIDFVLKESPESLTYIIALIERVLENTKTKVLVVDDSITMRSQIKYYLQSQLYQVFSASDPVEGLQILEKHPEIKIITTDYNMPNLNGIEFLKIIRRNYDKNRMAVVGISSDEKSSIAFLKHGANDFITKPFIKEGFVCRINNTAEALHNVKKLEEVANKDFLTKVANRKYFFEEAEVNFAKAKAKKRPYAIAMIDIDNFKKINDTYGHTVGDRVIKKLADLLRENSKGHDIVARYGGEEFILYLKDISPSSAVRILQNICQKIADYKMLISEKETLQFTVSIGVCTSRHSTLSAAIEQADESLYVAKQSGKNRVVDDLIIA
ncbi:MAG: diguanylate cyclase [Epsilonproteobacteria bacterium]|nr:diguanylate cyclase [Campylobacterota bacterium]